MSRQELSGRDVTVEAENIGGIDDTVVDLTPGINVLTGRNATNRTSFLKAIMAAMGSDDVALKTDASEGAVALHVGDETYTRTLSRRDGRVATDGDPYLDDPVLADLFAFLLETNECRQAVARGEDLREIIMRPVDTDEIEREIRSLRDERDEIDERLVALDDLSERSLELEEELERLRERRSETVERLSEKRAELEEADKDVEESRAEDEELDAKMTQLQEARRRRAEVDREIESERESIAALEADLAEKRADLDDVDAVPEDEIDRIEEEIGRLRGREEALEQALSELQSVIQFNAELLEDGRPVRFGGEAGGEDEGGGTVTDRLLDDADTVTCWTCGSEVTAEQIESRVDALRSVHREHIQDRQSLKDEIEALKREEEEYASRRDRHERVRRDVDRIESELAEREDTLANLESTREDLVDEVERVADEVESLQQEDHGAVLELQEEVNRLEFERDDVESDVAEVEAELESIDGRLEERDEIEARRAEIHDELEELRMHVQRLQEVATDEFNDHMEAILDLLEYGNLERIWIERVTEPVREGRRTVERDRFDLHIVRGSASGSIYEDTVDNLSESEREVTGLVFALAGYLVHDVYEEVPFMLLDSIEAIDAQRIARLIEYLDGFAEYLVVALLDEDAAALDEAYRRVTSI